MRQLADILLKLTFTCFLAVDELRMSRLLIITKDFAFH